MKALIFSANNFVDSELLVPISRLQEAGYSVEIASHARGTIRGRYGNKVKVDKAFAEVDTNGYDILLLLGGKDLGTIKNEPSIQEISRNFFSASIRW